MAAGRWCRCMAAGLAVKGWMAERGWLRRRRLEWPVISVGSVSAGGAGKTPVVLLLAELLRQAGLAVRVLVAGVWAGVEGGGAGGSGGRGGVVWG